MTDLWTLELPGNASHNVDSVSPSYSDTEAAETSSVRGMTVSTDHEQAGEGVVLQDNLQVYNTDTNNKPSNQQTLKYIKI